MFLRPPGQGTAPQVPAPTFELVTGRFTGRSAFTRRWAAVGGGGGPLFTVDQVLHTLIGAAVDLAGIPPDKVSFGHAVAAVTDTVTAVFPSSRV